MNRYDFERARKLYPKKTGKRGFDEEWDAFTKIAKYRGKYDKIMPQLVPAIERQIAYRDECARKNIWCPVWKDFCRWMKGGWWTEEVPQTNKPKPNRCVICDNTDVVSSEDGKGWRCWRDACKKEYEKL